ncbi:activating signal cointegrator 1 complex subunit 1 isoform X1 [Pieris napi]|uniref:activating signal cointegrator 1 complex subunit 1 isoform X1 n=1 Tax=Pieris napi TaxID=78633 RepID=UPI001FB9071F|nr:activating signal cointegrator 1 complex subunit 1 isoform X1 [Pieris napi]
MNDILKPELIWIENRCYRVNDPIVDVSFHQEHDLYENDMPYQDLQENDDDTDFEVQMIDSDRYCTTFHVSKHYLGNIIGKKGAIKMRIQRDTKTDIKIPRMGENKDVVIYGPSIPSVKAARRKINMIVISARMRQRSTHFISLPMNSEEIVKNFDKFKEMVLQDCRGRGLHESIFIRASKLHITVGVMCLMDNEERLLASKYLAEVKEHIMPMIQNHLPLKLRLKGLSYMNDDPKEMHVLYGSVQEDDAHKGVLQDMIDAIAQFFFKKGLMANEFGRDNVKIHVTLLNSKYRGKTIENDSPTKQQRESFDGSEILEKFNDYDFGVMEINNIHLSQRKSLAPDGFYQPTCVISL